MNHLVSVIIPTFNREHFLSEAIQSVIAQTYRPIECIVVDDGSTDETKTLVETLNLSTPESFILKYIYQSNSGSQVARNTGTHASTGEFIQYLDSDDLLYPEKLEKQVEYLKTHPECDGVWGSWAKGTVDKNELIQSYAREDLLTQFFTEHCIHTLSFLMRKVIIEKIGPWDVNIKRNQEIDFHLRGLMLGANYQYQPQICGLWRIHDGERIANKTGAKEFLNFYQKWERILIQKGLFNALMKKNISNIYFWFANTNKIKENENLSLLEEAVRLNPEISFVQSWKMRFLISVIGLRNSLRLWLIRTNYI